MRTTRCLIYTAAGRIHFTAGMVDIIFLFLMHRCLCMWLILAFDIDSDITALAKDRAYAQIHLNELSIHQVRISAKHLF